MIDPMSPTCLAKPSMNPFSVVVFVSDDELANMLSKVDAISLDFDASLILTTYHPTVPAPVPGPRASSR